MFSTCGLCVVDRPVLGLQPLTRSPQKKQGAWSSELGARTTSSPCSALPAPCCDTELRYNPVRRSAPSIFSSTDFVRRCRRLPQMEEEDGDGSTALHRRKSAPSAEESSTFFISVSSVNSVVNLRHASFEIRHFPANLRHRRKKLFRFIRDAQPRSASVARHDFPARN